MEKFKRCLIYLIVTLTVLSLSGCDGSTEPNNSNGSVSSVPAPAEPIAALPFDLLESFDPFKTASAFNHAVFPLVYPGLFINDADFSSVPYLASGYTVSGKQVTLTLKNLVFSDGTPVTAADVVNSFSYARSSERYSSRFKYITSFKEKNGSVVITFKQNAELCLALLDIPVIKRGGEVPLGIGSYAFGKDGAKTVLVKNSKISSDAVIEKINLYSIGDASSTVHSFNKKSVSAVLSELSTNTVIFKGNYEIKSYITNNFVFIGFNTYNPLFADKGIRKAFNAVIDRSLICSVPEFSEPVWHPINPLHYGLSSFELPDSIYMPDLAEDILVQKGYKKRNGYYNVGELTLIVNSEDSFKLSLADAVAKQLNAFGIKVAVKALTFDNYSKALSAGQFDLYLAETVMPINMDVTVLNGASLNFSGSSYLSFDSVYNALASGDTASLAFDGFIDESPIISLCYRKNQLVYSRIFTADPSPFQFSLYNGLLTSELQNI